MDNHITHVSKNVAYSQLSAEKQALLLANSPCDIELTDADLQAICGGRDNPCVMGTLGNLGLFGVLGDTYTPGPSSVPGASSVPATSSMPKSSTNPGTPNTF